MPRTTDVSSPAPHVRMIDIARSLGVSRATVSLVMRNSPQISEATRQAVLAEAERLGYVYNTAAGALRSRRSNVVGLVMPDILNPFIGELSLGIQEVLTAQGFFVVIANTHDEEDAQHHILRSLAEQRVAGVILIPTLSTAADHLATIGQQPTPTVLLTRRVDATDLPFVGTDDGPIGELGARHLMDVHQCRTVAYFGGPAEATPRIDRLSTFRRSAEERDVTLSAEWTAPCPPTFDGAYELATRLLSEGPHPDGVLCHSDNVAYGLLKALAVHGGGHTCRVVGIDDLHLSAQWTPSLSSIAVEPDQIGRVTARRLLREIGIEAPGPTDPPLPQLKARSSCGCEGD